jgi:hypothetical protein
MKNVALITVVGVAVLVLATGAWIADGVRAVRSTTRRRRTGRAAERHALREARRHHAAAYLPERPDRFAVA